MLNIAIHSVPRSGSTWLGSIFDSHPNVVYKYQPLFSYALKGYLTPTSTASEIHNFFKKLESTHDSFMDQLDAKKRGIVPEFSKGETRAVVYKEVRYHHLVQNLLEQTNDVMVVGLIRSPLATLHSWWQAPKEFRPELGWKFEEEWLGAPQKNLSKPEEYNGYLKWKEVALVFESLNEKFPDRFYLLNYSSLIQTTEQTVEKLFSFVGLSFTTQTTDFLRQSKISEITDAYGVYKIKNNDMQWKGRLPESIVNFITKDLSGSVLEKYLE